MKLIVDLDDTLLSTTNLNNDAYNFAIENFGHKPIESSARITRADIINIEKNKLKKIVKLKQTYFLRSWLKYRVTINFELLEIIKKAGRNNCYIWTASNKCRAKALLKSFKLMQYFKKIIFDKKNDLNLSINKITKHIKSDNFFIYENNFTYFENSNYKLISNMKNNLFNVYCYKIS